MNKMAGIIPSKAKIVVGYFLARTRLETVGSNRLHQTTLFKWSILNVAIKDNGENTCATKWSYRFSLIKRRQKKW